MKKVAIVGFGRFGKILKSLLEKDFELTIINKNNTVDIVNSDVIFYCVPISAFESVIKSHKNYTFWKDFFIKKGLKVIKMSAQEHDKLAANSQGVTHFIGRLLEKFAFKRTEIDSLGAKKLQEVMGQTCNDTWQLFSDLQNYNPYTKSMRIKLGRTYDLLYNQLLPKRINRKKIIIGIQGGKGSFNEEAILFFY